MSLRNNLSGLGLRVLDKANEHEECDISSRRQEASDSNLMSLVFHADADTWARDFHKQWSSDIEPELLISEM